MTNIFWDQGNLSLKHLTEQVVLLMETRDKIKKNKKRLRDPREGLVIIISVIVIAFASIWSPSQQSFGMSRNTPSFLVALDDEIKPFVTRTILM